MNKRIKLVSPTYEITEAQKRTSAAVMRDWRKGDIIRFSTVMKAMAGASGGGVYASSYTAHNLTQGTSVTKSQTQLSAYFGFGTDSAYDRYAVFTIQEKEDAN